MFGLKQVIKSPTRITCRNTYLIDCIGANIPSRISRHGIINVGVSDHQCIYWQETLKIKIKTGGVHKYLSFCYVKKYTVDAYKDALKKFNFPNNKLFNDINKAYLFQKIRAAIANIAPGRTKSGKKKYSKMVC